MATLADLFWEGPTNPATWIEHEHYFAGLQHHPEIPALLRREYYERGVHSGYDRHLDFYALYLVRGGSGVHRINGTPYGLARGDVYLMPPGTLHAYENWEKLEIDAFYFPSELFEPAEMVALRELQGFWGLLLDAPQASHRLHLAPETWRRFDETVMELREEYLADESAAALVFKHGVFRLLVRLGRQARENNGQHMAPSHEWAALLSWMEENCAQPLSIAQLAARSFLSPRHFRELFTRETGQPPSSYLRQLRLEKARAFLQDDGLSITQIAMEAGFADAAHFSRLFKAFYGTSPREFRRRFQR